MTSSSAEKVKTGVDVFKFEQTRDERSKLFISLFRWVQSWKLISKITLVGALEQTVCDLTNKLKSFEKSDAQIFEDERRQEEIGLLFYLLAQT